MHPETSKQQISAARMNKPFFMHISPLSVWNYLSTTFSITQQHFCSNNFQNTKGSKPKSGFEP